TVHCTGSDSHGNTGCCTFTVTVNDCGGTPQGCIVAQLEDITVPCVCDNPQGTGSTTATWNDPTVTDGTLIGCVPSSGSSFSVGTTKVTCTGQTSDGSPCSSSFNVIVQAATPPVLSGCPSETASFECISDVKDPPTVTATDCSGNPLDVSYTQDPETLGHSSCNVTITRTWSATDGCQTTTCKQTITVNDDIA